MRLLKASYLGALALILATFAASEAQAQIVRVADVQSVGGFVAHSDKTTIWADVTNGRLTRGYIQVERRGRGGSGTPIYMTGSLGAAETYGLWVAVYNAQPWRTPRVRARFVNTDLPNTIVTYLGQYRQEILASFVSPSSVPAGIPLVSASMERFLSLNWTAVGAVAQAPLFVYEGSGGMLGYRRKITIARNGAITDDVSYQRPNVGAPYTKQGNVSAADLATLANLSTSWSSYPAAFAGNPRMYDGIGIDLTLYRWGAAKKVFAGEPANRPASFQRVLDKVEALADAIP